MLLTENIHPKIEGMIQRFEETNTHADPYEHLEISINIEDGDFIEVKLLKGGRQRGIIEAVKYNQRCLDAFEVTWAKGRLGLGPLLYDISMEVASQESTGLMCDRSSVSEAAFDVWDKYLHMRCKVDKAGKCKSPDIEIMQLDNERFPVTPQIEDDCRGQSSWNHYKNDVEDEYEVDGIDDQPYKDYWHNEDPLSKVYIKKRPAVIKRLLPFIKWKTGNLSTSAPGWV